tara:strand:- start:991 stop:1266 length:276 start_codon:yes stop_codon:yes gene_type:complete
MAIKTIAVQVEVYDQLESFKQPKESFSKAIGRLLDEQGVPKKPKHGTGAAVYAYMTGPDAPEPLTDEEAEIMLSVVREHRENAKWPLRDLS